MVHSLSSFSPPAFTPPQTEQCVKLSVLCFIFASLLFRSVHSGHRLLLPGGRGFAPAVFPSPRRGGGLVGLVPLPRPHLLPPADDGSCFVSVGGEESPQKLQPHDGVQGSLKRDCYNFLPESDFCSEDFLKNTSVPVTSSVTIFK